MDTTEIYIEIYKAPNSPYWSVVAPSHTYNNSLIYDEIEVICSYEWEQQGETVAYLSGPNVVEVDIDYDEIQVLDKILNYKSTQGTRISFDQKLVCSIDSEVERQFTSQY